MEIAEPTVRPTDAAASATRERLLVYAGAAAYALVFVAATTIVFRAFQYSRLDLGNMTQAVWATAHGHFLGTTTPAGHEFVRLGAHVDPFLVLFVPLWWVWPSPLLLLVVQAIAVAAGALPVYWLARKHLGPGLPAVGFAFAYLLYPATQYNALTASGPHPVSFAVPLILLSIWFLDNDRLLPFAAVALLAATTKEEIPVAVGCLGIWYAVRRGRRATGLAIFAAGLTITLVDFLVVIPHFSPSGADPFAGRYAAVGGSPTGMIRTLVTHPGVYVDVVATHHKLRYLGFVLIPFLGLWLLEPLLALGAVPDLVVNLLSTKPEQTSIVFQYSAGIVPFLVAAAILGSGRLRLGTERVAAALVVVGVAFLGINTPLRAAVRDLPAARASDTIHSAKVRALRVIPPGVPVTATNKLGGYLSDRRVVYVFPHVGDARWALLEQVDLTYDHPAAVLRAQRAIETSPRWQLVFSSQGIEVLQRRETGG